MHRVKPFMILVVVAAVLSLGSVASAALVTLRFDPNDIFNYATSDDSRLNQQGTARFVETLSVTGRDYRTYNDVARDSGATAANDLQSVKDILGWSGTHAGFQGVSHVQLWLNDYGNVQNWGEKVVMKPYTTIGASVNGEYDWTANIGENPWDSTPNNGTYEPGTDEYGLAHFNTELLGEGHQNALSPAFNPADQIWEVTGDFYVDNNLNGLYDAGDSDLVAGQGYTIWFNARFNNWRCQDAYGNDNWGSFDVQGTIIATAIPEPATIVIWSVLGLAFAGAYRWRRRNGTVARQRWPEGTTDAIHKIVDRGRMN